MNDYVMLGEPPVRVGLDDERARFHRRALTSFIEGP